MPLYPSPTRQREVVYPTPDLDDLIFFEHETLSRVDYASDSDMEDAGFSIGSAHWDTTNFPNHKVVHLEHDPGYGQADEDSLRFKVWYAIDRSDASQEAYVWEFSEADIGGRKFDAIVLAYVTPRTSASNTAPAIGSAAPTTLDTYISGASSNFVLATREIKRIGDKVMGKRYVTEILVYIAVEDTYSLGYDQATDGHLSVTEKLYYRGQQPDGSNNIETLIADSTAGSGYWGLIDSGSLASSKLFLREGRQLTHNWFLVKESDVIPDGKVGTGNPFSNAYKLREYGTFENIAWPAVLGESGVTGTGSPYGALEIMNWVDKDGNDRTYPRPQFKRRAWRGPTPVRITEYFSKTAMPYTTLESPGGGLSAPIALTGEPIVYNSPYLSISIPPCLHPAITLVCNTSATDPVWGLNSGSDRTFPATNPGDPNPNDWNDHTHSIQQQPFRNGYLIRVIEAFVPDDINN